MCLFEPTNIKIRVATVDEMKELWNYSNSNTYKYFIEGLIKGNIEFWTVENTKNNKLIGELYIFWNSTDLDEADGFNRAYLCAFRISQKFRGLGLGSKLMESVLQRVKEKGFTEVTIGIDNENYDKLKNMYSFWGFKNIIKEQYYDYHCLDKNNNYIHYDMPVELYLNKLV